LLPGGRPQSVARIPTPARSRPGLGASLRQPLPGCSGTELGAAALFDEVIRCDRTYGPILAEIKAAYDTFLGDRGASVPEDPIAVVGFVTGDSTASDARPGAPKRSSEQLSTSGAAELAVDAARRRWTEPEDMTSRGDFAKESELERENAAVRALVERLQVDLENAKESDRRKQEQRERAKKVLERHENLQRFKQESAPQVRPDPWQQLPPEGAQFQRSEPAGLPPEDPTAAGAPPASTPLKPALPIPVRGFQMPELKVSLPATTGAQSGRWSSARSSSASTISDVHSIDDSHLWPLGLWAARQTPPGPSALQAGRPLEVPTLDLSRISWLIDEASESNEGYYDDVDGGQVEITPPPAGAADAE